MEQLPETYLVFGNENTNRPAPEFHETVRSTLAAVEASHDDPSDPAFAAYRTQTLGHLRHISFDFRLADDSPDYVHAPVLAGPYPHDPTVRQLAKAELFLRLTGGETSPMYTPFGQENQAVLDNLKQTQLAIDRAVIDNPETSYADFANRLSQHGYDADFPEFSPTLTYLKERLLSGTDVAAACGQSQLVRELREAALSSLYGATTDEQQQPKTPRYREAIYAIETALEFFDIAQRSTHDAPKLYHSDRYEYYLHFLLGQQDHVLYPTITSTGATDLLKLRHVPIGIAGVVTEMSYVDGFLQTSYEFFHHDINHSRRMYQFFKELAAKRRVSPNELSRQGGELLADELLPSVRLQTGDSEATKQLKRTGRMLLFEVQHEDALPVDRQTILEAMFRAPLTRTPFERILDNHTVEYFMEAGATTLAYVYRKMAHTFYDSPELRMQALGAEELRNRTMVIQAALRIFRALGGNGLTEKEAVIQFEQLVATDQGFPDAFFATVEDDIAARRADKDGDFGFFVARPENAARTIEVIRGIGKKVISLFGYSDLGYAQPQLLERQIRDDLSRYDPDDTLVVIGATAAGIGRGYGIADDMGFETASIVSTKVLAHDGRFAPHAGEIHLVSDTQWGGYLPGTTRVSPTTEAFVGASDVILSYGGGDNTAVALREAKRRGGIVLKHRAHAMDTGGTGGAMYGPALGAWREIKAA